MRQWLLTALLCLAATQAVAASTPRQDAMLDDYFALWDNDGAVTPANVARLYARQITYYGHAMSRADLYRDKLGFIRQWPKRRYQVEPGTASKRCDATESTCVFSAVLSWERSGASGTQTGRSRVNLTVAQDDGGLKIVREGAVTLAR